MLSLCPAGLLSFLCPVQGAHPASAPAASIAGAAAQGQGGSAASAPDFNGTWWQWRREGPGIRRLSIKSKVLQELYDALPSEDQQALAQHVDEGKILLKDLTLKKVKLSQLGGAFTDIDSEVTKLADLDDARPEQYRSLEKQLRCLLDAELKLPPKLLDVEAAGSVEAALAAAENYLNQQFNTSVTDLIKRCKGPKVRALLAPRILQPTRCSL